MFLTSILLSIKKKKSFGFPKMNMDVPQPHICSLKTTEYKVLPLHLSASRVFAACAKLLVFWQSSGRILISFVLKRKEPRTYNIAPAMKCRERSKPVGRGLRPRRNAKPTNLRCKIVADRPECDPYQTVSCHNISSPHL